MARIPRRVQVGPYRLAVVVNVPALEQHTADKGDRPGSLAGGCDVPEGRIVLRPGMAPDYTAETLLHELLHAAVVAGGSNVDRDAEEAFVSAIAPSLLDTLRRTRGLVEYLLDPE